MSRYPTRAPDGARGRPPAVNEALRISRANPGLLPGLMLVALLGLWAYRDGGFDVVDWAPGALFVTALVLVLLVALPQRTRPPRRILVCLALLGAFTAWNYLSLAWAEVPSEALTGANRTFLYLAVFALVALTPWRPTASAILIGAYTLSVGAVSLVSFWRVVEAGDASFFREGRLAAPITYANASCALYVTTAIAAVFLASRRTTPLILRGVFLAVGGIVVELALLTQSRASLGAVPLTLAILLVLSPGRLRLLLSVAVVGAVVLVATPGLLDVYTAIVADRHVAGALAHARATVLVSALVLAVAGTVIGIVDERIEVPRPVAVTVGRVLLGGLALVLLVGAIGFLASDPQQRARVEWDRFRNEHYVIDADTPHLTSGFGSGRYRLWKVALGQFRDHPFLGAGSDNFGVDYLRERSDLAQPTFPHSIVLRTLAQTGLVGTALLLAFLCVAGMTVWQRLRGSPAARGIVALAVSLFAYWFIHGSIDWFWEIPVLGASAFAWLGLAMRTGDDEPDERPLPAGVRRGVLAGVLLAAAAGAVAVGGPWLAAREIDTAASTWPSDPSRAYVRLDRARTLDPLTDEADVIEALIAERLGDTAHQERSLLHALERNPTNWYPMLELAALESRRARWRAAETWLDRAAELNPREYTIGLVRDEVDRRKPVSVAYLHRLLVSQVTLITGEKQT